ncbi:hypothetical protein [Phyllobacterium lublinensis]|nr:hypothetical protein [Phyllobacterium sp. 2063]
MSVTAKASILPFIEPGPSVVGLYRGFASAGGFRTATIAGEG